VLLALPKQAKGSPRKARDLHLQQPIKTKSSNHGHSPVVIATALKNKAGRANSPALLNGTNGQNWTQPFSLQ
jgi:hypothetical protein